MRRREFVAAASIAAPSVVGASNRVRIGLIGCGGRGRYVTSGMLKAPDTELVAACDVYDDNAARASKDLSGGKAPTFRDFRKVLDSKDVDAVVVATPDHWHAIVTVLACKAGKDVLVEKPFSLTVKQGRAMVDAARRYKRFVMAATQHRSSPHIAEAARIVQSGEIGEVPFVRVWNSGNVTPRMFAPVPDSEPPAGLDWDMYLGPAPKVPFNRNRFLARFRQYWDYSGGYLTDYGNHRFDSVHQIMNAKAPLTVSSVGRRIAKENAGDIWDLQTATYEYPGFLLEYAACWINSHGLGGRSPGMRYYGARGLYNRPHGMAFYGTKAALFVDRLGYEIFPELEPVSFYGGPVPPESELKYRTERKTFNGSDATALHAQNFIKYLRNGEPPNPDAETGHRATSACLLGNIAARVGRTIRWDPEREEIVGDREASKLLSREARPPWNIL